ncbi:MAG: 3-methyl-2-oxobutanoate hydroxymethyltransferase [Methylomonas sp.]|jgi:3-methyl-2-oxobutanoate hydroxymethyltransferase
MSLYTDSKTLTISDLQAMKRNREKIACLTVYDASFSAVLDQCGIEILLVGDSLGMVIQGHANTLPVTVDDMVYHSRIVASARKRAFMITDMPFASYATPEQAVQTAARLTQAGAAQMVKLEGAKPDIIAFMVEQGFSVCGHLGLLPQHINRVGNFKVQGRELSEAQRILDDAKKIEQAGAGLLILECVPAELAAEICRQSTIPVIGIGAGSACDGQVLVLYDILGLNRGAPSKFAKNFLAGADGIADAVKRYYLAVKSGEYPDSEHCY